MLGTVGFLLAIIVNVDAVRIAHTFYVDEPVRQAVVAQATADRNCAAMPGARMRARGGAADRDAVRNCWRSWGRCFPGLTLRGRHGGFRGRASWAGRPIPGGKTMGENAAVMFNLAPYAYLTDDALVRTPSTRVCGDSPRSYMRAACTKTLIGSTRSATATSET